MEDNINVILFWVSFVGYAMFMVNSIYNIIVLRHTQKHIYPYSEFAFSTLFLVLGTLFAVFSLNNYFEYDKLKTMDRIDNTEKHIQIGVQFMVNPDTSDTTMIKIFKEIDPQ